MVAPSTNGKRKTNGQFGTGNTFGKGNPHAAKVAQLRSALIEHITPEDLKEIVTALLTQAKAGDIASCKLLLPYLVGPAPTVCEPDAIELQGLERKAKIAEQIRLEKHLSQWSAYD
jgi:hypothetical protein